MKNKSHSPIQAPSGGKTTYSFPISEGLSITFELPKPIEKFGKRERNKLRKEAHEFVDSLYNKSKLEAIAKRNFYLSEAERIKTDFDL